MINRLNKPDTKTERLGQTVTQQSRIKYFIKRNFKRAKNYPKWWLEFMVD